MMAKNKPNDKLKVPETQRFEAILEDIDGKFQLLSEGMTELLKLNPRVDRMSEDIEEIKTDISLIKNDLKHNVVRKAYSA